MSPEGASWQAARTDTRISRPFVTAIELGAVEEAGMTASHHTIETLESALREMDRAAAGRSERAFAPSSVRRRRGRIVKPSG
jgi:hypothetical protein